MKNMSSKLMMYAKTAVTLAQLPFYFLSYKVSELRYKQYMQAASQTADDMLLDVDSPLVLAR